MEYLTPLLNLDIADGKKKMTNFIQEYFSSIDFCSSAE